MAQAAACISCGLEAFSQDYSIPDALSMNKIPCQKDFVGCMYSAQGAIICNSTSKPVENFVPSITLGGLPNMFGSPLVEKFAGMPSSVKPQRPLAASKTPVASKTPQPLPQSHHPTIYPNPSTNSQIW